VKNKQLIGMVQLGIVLSYPFRVCNVKRTHLSLSKRQKLFLVLSFIIHWNVIQFVEVVTTMTLIYEGAMF
jgi:hypothetical protein